MSSPSPVSMTTRVIPVQRVAAARGRAAGRRDRVVVVRAARDLDRLLLRGVVDVERHLVRLARGGGVGEGRRRLDQRGRGRRSGRGEHGDRQAQQNGSHPPNITADPARPSEIDEGRARAAQPCRGRSPLGTRVRRLPRQASFAQSTTARKRRRHTVLTPQVRARTPQASNSVSVSAATVRAARLEAGRNPWSSA